MSNPEAWDKNGIPILPGDLLKTYHYRDGRRNMYIYHVAYRDDRQFLMARPYDEPEGSNCFRLVGKQAITEAVAGLHRHDIDDPIIRPYFRRFVRTDITGKKSLLCQPHERVKVKNDQTQNA